VADDPEPAGEGDIQRDYSSNQLCSPSIGAVTENYVQEIRSVYLLFDNLRWSRGNVLAFSTQVRGFKPGRSRRIF